MRDAKAAASPDLTQIEEGEDEQELDGQKVDIDLGQIEQKFAAQKAQLERNDSVGQWETVSDVSDSRQVGLWVHVCDATS